MGKRKRKKLLASTKEKYIVVILELLFLGHFSSSFRGFSKPSRLLVQRTGKTPGLAGELGKPVAQTERHVSHLEHLELVPAQMKDATVMQEQQKQKQDQRRRRRWQQRRRQERQQRQ